MAGTSKTLVQIRMPPFLMKILNEQKSNPITTTKLYSIVGLYYDKLITSEQCNYFIKYFVDPRAQEKMQLMKDLIDGADKGINELLQRKYVIAKKKFIADGLNLLIKSPHLHLKEKEFCEEMMKALEEI